MVNKYSELGKSEYNSGIKSKSAQQQTQHFKKALKFFNQAVEENPDNKEFKDNLAATYNQIGVIELNCGSRSETNHERKQHYITARDCFNEAIIYNSNNKKFKKYLADTYYNLGIIESDCGSKSKSDEEKEQYYITAMDCFNVAIAYNPDNKEFKASFISMYNVLFNISYDQQGKEYIVSAFEHYYLMNQDVTNEEFRANLANLMDKLCQPIKIEFTAKPNVNSNQYEKGDCNKVDDHNTQIEKSDLDNHFRHNILLDESKNFASKIQSERSNKLLQGHSK